MSEAGGRRVPIPMEGTAGAEGMVAVRRETRREAPPPAEMEKVVSATAAPPPGERPADYWRRKVVFL